MRVIKAKVNVSVWLLLLVWLLILVGPVLTFRFVQNYFLNARFKQSVQKIKPLMLSEMKLLSEDLDETGWLSEKLAGFDQSCGFVTISDEAGQSGPADEFLNARSVHERLEKHLGFNVLAVFSHGADAGNCNTWVRDAEFSQIKDVPGLMLRRFMYFLSRQNEMAIMFPEAFQTPFRGTAADDERNRGIYFENFLQSWFGTIIPLAPEPYRLVKTIASKCGDTGQIYFYYAPARRVKSGRIYNAGGYFAVIRLQDIPEKMILRDILASPFYPELKRGFGFMKSPLPEPEDYSDVGISQFVMHEDRFSLQTIAPEKVIVRLVQKGTIVPDRQVLDRADIPAVEVSVPVEKLHHSLQKYTPLVDQFLILILGLGTLLLVRIFFFGFDQKASFSVKIMVGVVIAFLLPVMSLMLAGAAFYDYKDNADRERLERQLRFRNAYFRSLIDDYCRNIQEETQQLARSLQLLNNNSREVVSAFLSEWIRERPVAGVLYRRLDLELIDLWSPDAIAGKDFRMLRDSMRLMLNSSIEYLLGSTLLTEDVSKITRIMTEGTDNMESNHFLLNSSARLLFLPRLSGETRLSFAMVYRDSVNQRFPAGVLLVDYDAVKLAKHALSEIQAAIRNASDSGKYGFAAAINSGDRLALADSGLAGLEKNHIIRQMTACGQLGSEIVWNRQDADTEIIALTQAEGVLPLILMSMARRSLSSESSVWLPLAYAMIIVFLALLLARIFFVRPALYLAAKLSEVADGNLGVRFLLSSGDEFEVIADECGKMTEGLIEKARMEEYVSSELLEQIRGSVEAEMQPGGERIAATVVFAWAGHLSEGSGAGLESSSLIELFMGVCDTICTQNGGVVDKVIGQTVMMVFREGRHLRDHRVDACHAILQIKSSLENSGAGLVLLAGISSGTLVSGKIGSRTGKLDYTVIGDVVNMAARLKAHSMIFSESTIIASESLADIENDLFVVKPEAEIRIKGKAERCRIFRLKAAGNV